MQKVGCITTFLHSINGTVESNENGRFSALLGLTKLIRGREIKNVFFSKIPKCLRKENTWRFYLYCSLFQALGSWEQKKSERERKK